MSVRNIRLSNRDNLQLLSPYLLIIDREDEQLLLSVSGQVVRYTAENSRVGRITFGSRSSTSLSLTGGVNTMRVLFENLIAARTPKAGAVTEPMPAIDLHLNMVST